MSIDVWILSRYDGKHIMALAFDSADSLVDYVVDYYDVPAFVNGVPNDFNVDQWLAPIAESFGYVMSVDHDTIAEQAVPDR